jgi:hypothetical protein
MQRSYLLREPWLSPLPQLRLDLFSELFLQAINERLLRLIELVNMRVVSEQVVGHRAIKMSDG